MLDLTVRALAWVLRIWLPDSRGRHRAGSPIPPPAPASRVTASPTPPGVANTVAGAAAHPHSPPPARTLDERVRRRATRGLRERRRALYLASLGFDSEPPAPRETPDCRTLVGAAR